MQQGSGTSKDTGKVAKKTGLAGIAEWAKTHPSVLVAAMAGAGIGGEEVMAHVNTILKADLPGWALVAIVGGYAAMVWARDVSSTLKEILARLANGDGRFEEIEGRLAKLESDVIITAIKPPKAGK